MGVESRRVLRLLGCMLLSASALGAQAASVGDDKASAIKGHNKVVIAEFGVEFYSQLHAEGRSGSANAQVTTQLDGVSETAFQAITDQAYADTVAALTKAGFEVVDPAAMHADAGYQKLEAKYGQASPQKYSDDQMFKGAPSVSWIYAPAGMKAFFSSAVPRGDLGQRIDVQNYGRGMKEQELAKALGATVLHVHYLSSFGVTSETKNNALLAQFRGAKAEVATKPVLVATDTEMQFVTESGPRTYTTSHRQRHSGAVYLKEALVAPTNIFTLTASKVAPSSEADFKSTYGDLIRDAATSMSDALAAARG
jgi:hypothetical protein